MAKAQAKTSADPVRKRHESFLVHEGFRYLKLSLLLCAAALYAYFHDDPHNERGGGTHTGYALGGLSLALIFWLAWLGVRRRSYRSRMGTVRGWTSAHVYLGASLALIAGLHCAFQFDWNVHTLAYALLLGVIASGLYGIVAYSRTPEQITANRAQETRETMIVALEQLNEQSLKLADAVSPEVHQRLVDSVSHARIGGGLRTQVFGPEAARFEEEATSTVQFMASQIAGLERAATKAERARELMDLLAQRQDLAERINQDIRLHARMQVWLYLHVPLTFALFAAVIAHVVSVFIYW